VADRVKVGPAGDIAREDEARALAAGRARGERPSSDALIDLLWRTVDGGQATAAWVELVVAARNDSTLKAELFQLMKEFDVKIADAFGRWLPSAAGAEPPRRLVFALMNGLVLDRMAGLDEHVPAVLAMVKAMARTALPSA